MTAESFEIFVYSFSQDDKDLLSHFQYSSSEFRELSVSDFHERLPLLLETIIMLFTVYNCVWLVSSIVKGLSYFVLNLEQRQNCAIYTLPTLFTGRRKFKGGRVSYSEATAAFVDFQCVSFYCTVCLKSSMTQSTDFHIIYWYTSLQIQLVTIIWFSQRAVQHWHY